VATVRTITANDPRTVYQLIRNELADELGQYKYVDADGNTIATVPAVWLRPPPVPGDASVIRPDPERTVQQSAIEAIVERVGNQTGFGGKPGQAVLTETITIWFTQYAYLQGESTRKAAAYLMERLQGATVQRRPLQPLPEQEIAYEQARVSVPLYPRGSEAL